MSEPAKYEEGMTYVEKLDFREQAHRHEMERIQLQEANATKRSKYELREARQETYQYVGIAIAVAAVILGIVYAIYRASTGDSGPDGVSSEERRESACVDNGGVWIPDDLLTSGEPLCVYPGKPVG